MKIGLIDIDSKIPNLALMKLSAYHKANGDEVDLIQPVMAWLGYDKLYASKVFTRSQMPSLPECVIGGSGSKDISKTLPNEIDILCPDYSLYPDMDYSMGFLTRGCIRNCDFCIVQKKEGAIRAYQNIDNFVRHEKVILMDNNVLAHEHGINQIQEIIKKRLKVDFNQGLDARLITPSVAKLLSKVRWLKPVRLACDSQSMKPVVEKAIKLLREANVTPKQYFVYCIIRDDTKEALDRINFLTSLNTTPFAQPYLDDIGTIPSKQNKELARWCNQPHMRKTRKFQDFYLQYCENENKEVTNVS